MIITCEHCAARYKLDPNRITGRGVRITCPRCKNVFVVYNSPSDPADGDDASSAGTASGPVGARKSPLALAGSPASGAAADDGDSTALFTRPGAPGAQGVRQTGLRSASGHAVRPSVESLDFASVGIQAWKVKVRIGLVYDFSDYKTLARYIKDGRVGDSDQISHNGIQWTRLGNIADLQEHFIQVYLDARRALDAQHAQDSLPAPNDFDDESPTMIVGASQLAQGLPNLSAPVPRAAVRNPADSLAATPAAATEAEDLNAGGAGSAPTGPRFQDPFSKARSQRSAASRSSRAAKAPRAAPPPKRSYGTLLVVLVLLGAASGGTWLITRNQRPSVDVLAAERARKDALLQRQSEAAQRKQRQQVSDEIKRALEADPEPLAVPSSDQDTMIPVHDLHPIRSGSAAAKASAPVRGNALGMNPVVSQGGSQHSSGISTLDSTPADYFSAGRSAYNAGRYSDAVAGFRQAAAGQPNRSDYHYWLGLALSRAGNGGEAMRELSTAAKRGAADAYNAMGDIAARQGDVAGAIGYYQSFLGTHPADAAAVQAKIDALTH